MSITGDRVRVSVSVGLEPALTFRVFTEEIDTWWRRGPAYRMARGTAGVVHLEPRVGGRLFESIERDGATKVYQTGEVIVWEPPRRLVLIWRAVNFAPAEKTEIEVLFEPTPTGTLVTVTHAGWSTIRPDHPVRHGDAVEAFVRRMGLWWGTLMTSLREHARDAVKPDSPGKER